MVSRAGAITKPPDNIKNKPAQKVTTRLRWLVVEDRHLAIQFPDFEDASLKISYMIFTAQKNRSGRLSQNKKKNKELPTRKQFRENHM